MNSKNQIIGKYISLLRRMYELFTPYRYSLIISFLAGLVVAGATAFTAFLVKPALDDIFLNKKEFYLYLIPFAFIAATFVKGFGRYMQNYFMTYAGLRVIEDLRLLVYNKLIHLPSSYHIGSSIGEMMSRVMNDVGSIRSSIPAAVMIIRQIFTIVGLVTTVIYQSPALSIYSIVALPVAFYPLILFSKKLRKFNERNVNLNVYMNLFVLCYKLFKIHTHIILLIDFNMYCHLFIIIINILILFI